LKLFGSFIAHLRQQSSKAFAATNYTYVHNIPLPATPSMFVRYVDTTPTQSSYYQRWNQYRYQSSSGILAGCNLYCGPRAYLVNVNGTLICWRDQNSNFWGQFKYPEFCIPDVETTNACKILIPNLAAVGYCNMILYQHIPAYANYTCCYDDHNSGVGLNIDLTLRYATTSYYTLRNAE
jgi:hypothetical protein